MVAQFLRLKLTLLANTFRRRPLQLIIMVIALAYGLVLAVLVAATLVSLRFVSPDIARAVVIVFGSTVTLGFALLPLVFGADDPLDPRRFTLYGIPTGALAFSLAIAACVSIPTLVVAVFAIAQVVTWSTSPGVALLAILAALLIVPTCVLSARVSTAIAAFFLASRRAREFAGVLLIAVLAVAAPLLAIVATVDWGSAGLPIMRRIAAVVTWTPWGAAWSIPADAAAGRPEAWIKLVISVVFLGVLWLVWRALVGRMLVTTQREAAQRSYSGLGWFGALPATPGGAIAARSLSYWGRDSRYRVALVVVPIVPILMVVALLIAGVPTEILVWIPLPVMCLFLGWTIHNDVAYDSTAFWSHVSSSTSGAADRWGRTIPVLFVGVPLIVLGSFVTAAIAGDWSIVPGLVGLSVFVLLVGLAISSVVSAAFPYPAVLPGDSPFAQPQVTGATGAVVQTLSFFAIAIAATPLLYLVYLGQTESAQWFFAVLGIGVVAGCLSLLAGVLWGGSLVRRHGPELLAFTLQN